MRLGLNLGYWGAGNDADNLVLAREADRLGYSVVWAAEAYGSDAATVLAWIAAQTESIDVGSAVFQIPGRTPANTAMTAATLDTLSGGRFRLGLGVSGPQVSEGWHGVRFDKPLARTREYVDIVKLALSRRKVKYDGEFFTLPLPDGPGKALVLTISAKDKDSIAAIQKRTDEMIEAKKAVGSGGASTTGGHDARGTHGGKVGLCPAHVPEGATITAKKLPGGMAITITPKDKLDELKAEVDARIVKAADWLKANVKDGDKGTTGGVGGGSGDHGSNHSGKGDGKGAERNKEGDGKGGGKGTGGGGGAGTGGGGGSGSAKK